MFRNPFWASTFFGSSARALSVLGERLGVPAPGLQASAEFGVKAGHGGIEADRHPELIDRLVVASEFREGGGEELSG